VCVCVVYCFVILMMLNTISVSLYEMIWCSVGLSCIAQIAGVMMFKGPEEKQLIECRTLLSNKNCNTLGLIRMLDILQLSSSPSPSSSSVVPYKERESVYIYTEICVRVMYMAEGIVYFSCQLYISSQVSNCIMEV
jgi:hypothetical protein